MKVFSDPNGRRDHILLNVYDFAANTHFLVDKLSIAVIFDDSSELLYPGLVHMFERRDLPNVFRNPA